MVQQVGRNYYYTSQGWSHLSHLFFFPFSRLVTPLTLFVLFLPPSLPSFPLQVEEIPKLPFTSPASAQAALDMRNSRFDRRLLNMGSPPASLTGGVGSVAVGSMSSSGPGGGGTMMVGPGPIERFNQVRKLRKSYPVSYVTEAAHAHE